MDQLINIHFKEKTVMFLEIVLLCLFKHDVT